MRLDLTVEEINFVLQTLGELPTKTGAWVLLTKIKQQADEQAKQALINTPQID